MTYIATRGVGPGWNAQVFSDEASAREWAGESGGVRASDDPDEIARYAEPRTQTLIPAGATYPSGGCGNRGCIGR